jgi:hypothetical protein
MFDSDQLCELQCSPSAQERSQAEPQKSESDIGWFDLDISRSGDVDDGKIVADYDLRNKWKSDDSQSSRDIGTEREDQSEIKVPVLRKQTSTISASFRNRPMKSATQCDPSPPPPAPSVSALPVYFIKQLSTQSKQFVHTKKLITQQLENGKKISSHHSRPRKSQRGKQTSSFQEEEEDDEEENEVENKSIPMIVTGTLLKKSKNLKFWRNRFVVLHIESGVMEWYKYRSSYIGDDQTSDIIRITPTTRLWQLPNSTRFTLQNQHQEWSFDACSQEELFRWLEPLCRVFRRVLEKHRAPSVRTRLAVQPPVKHHYAEEMCEVVEEEEEEVEEEEEEEEMEEEEEEEEMEEEEEEEEEEIDEGQGPMPMQREMSVCL